MLPLLLKKNDSVLQGSLGEAEILRTLGNNLNVAVLGQQVKINMLQNPSFGVRVPEDKFNQILSDRFCTPNSGSAKERTLQNAIETGKIQSGEAGLRPLRKQLENQLGIDVDISVIKRGGAFDQRPIIRLPKGN